MTDCHSRQSDYIPNTSDSERQPVRSATNLSDPDFNHNYRDYQNRSRLGDTDHTLPSLTIDESPVTSTDQSAQTDPESQSRTTRDLSDSLSHALGDRALGTVHDQIAERLNTVRQQGGVGSARQFVDRLNQDLQATGSPYRFRIPEGSGNFVSVTDAQGDLISTRQYYNESQPQRPQSDRGTRQTDQTNRPASRPASGSTIETSEDREAEGANFARSNRFSNNMTTDQLYRMSRDLSRYHLFNQTEGGARELIDGLNDELRRQNIRYQFDLNLNGNGAVQVRDLGENRRQWQEVFGAGHPIQLLRQR